MSLLPRLVWSEARKNLYIDNVKRLLSDYNRVAEIESKGSFTTDCIRKAAGRKDVLTAKEDNFKPLFKKPWFDRECWRLRERSFAFLNNHRTSDSDIIKQFYLSVNKEYRKLCERKQREQRKMNSA